MPVDPSAIRNRWISIRRNCNLSLEASKVADALSVKETVIVKARIRETLAQFARYRVQEKRNVGYHSGSQAGGDLATCEGIETFMVPAVEEAYSFEELLSSLDADTRAEFITTFKLDVNGLLDKWSRGEFSGEPYTETRKIKQALEVGGQQAFAPYNITETAAMACRVIIHVLTLKYHLPEHEFQSVIGPDLADARLFEALGKAISFLINSFQKSPKEGTPKEKIANAEWGDKAGSGWSWTANRPNFAALPPMLFFTAVVVDAFAELDLYLIRRVTDESSGPCAPAIKRFFDEHSEDLELLDLCVDMSRRWVQSNILVYLASGSGQYEERYPDGVKMKLADAKETRTFYYNSLYALQILLWSFADRKDNSDEDTVTRSLINKAITLLVERYQWAEGLRTALGKVRHIFLLPGKDVFIKSDEAADCRYEDAGFLPLMTRLLILFLVYGVGDRNLLEPIIADLYVELMQRRNRDIDPTYGALWSTDEVEVFSTQRAIQSLTFYFAYAAGKEFLNDALIDRLGGPRQSPGGLELQTVSGRRVILQIVDADAKEAAASSAPPRGARTPPIAEPPDVASQFLETLGQNAADYIKKAKFRKKPKTYDDFPESGKLQEEAGDLLSLVFESGNKGLIPDVATAKRIVDGLLIIWQDPYTDDKQPQLRQGEFASLKEQCLRLTGQPESKK